MKAIEIKANENMDDVDEEELWMKAITSNPAVVNSAVASYAFCQ